MTWEEFKRLVKDKGIEDCDNILCIDYHCNDDSIKVRKIEGKVEILGQY